MTNELKAWIDIRRRAAETERRVVGLWGLALAWRGRSRWLHSTAAFTAGRRPRMQSAFERQRWSERTGHGYGHTSGREGNARDDAASRRKPSGSAGRSGRCLAGFGDTRHAHWWDGAHRPWDSMTDCRRECPGMGGTGLSLDRLVGTLQTHGITGRIPDALAFARAHHVLLMRHEATGTSLDVYLARSQPPRFWSYAHELLPLLEAIHPDELLPRLTALARSHPPHGQVALIEAMRSIADGQAGLAWCDRQD